MRAMLLEYCKSAVNISFCTALTCYVDPGDIMHYVLTVKWRVHSMYNMNKFVLCVCEIRFPPLQWL